MKKKINITLITIAFFDDTLYNFIEIIEDIIWFPLLIEEVIVNGIIVAISVIIYLAANIFLDSLSPEPEKKEEKPKNKANEVKKGLREVIPDIMMTEITTQHQRFEDFQKLLEDFWKRYYNIIGVNTRGVQVAFSLKVIAKLYAESQRKLYAAFQADRSKPRHMSFYGWTYRMTASQTSSKKVLNFLKQSWDSLKKLFK